MNIRFSSWQKKPIQRAEVWLAAGLALFKLWLVAAQPLGTFVLGTHDDGHFLTMARYLLQGRWAGPYDQFTLIKGPFYPLWIAAMYRLSVPLVLSHHLLYILACGLMVAALLPLLPRPPYRVLIFAILLFNPISYHSATMPRVIREGIYPALTLLVLAAALHLAGLDRKALHARAARPWLWAAGLGGCLAAFWLTREESVWLLPSLGLIWLLHVYRLWRERSGPQWGWLAGLAPWGLALGLWLGLVGAVYALNQSYYGVFARTELDQADFKAAYGALTRVKSSTWYPDVPVTRAARKQIYAVSPSFARLRPYLEGDLGDGWVATSNEWTPGGPALNELRGGWFVWAFRDAVAAAGQYSHDRFPAAYYRRLAKEIDAACEAQKLDCLPPRASLAPPWRSEYLRPLLQGLWQGAGYLARYEGFSVRSVPVLGRSAAVDGAVELTGQPLNVEYWLISGWAFQKGGPVGLLIRDAEGHPTITTIERRLNTDIYDRFLAQGQNIPEAKTAAFEVRTNCIEHCSLEISAPGHVQRLDIDSIPAQGMELQDGDLYVGIYGVASHLALQAETLSGRDNQAKISALEGIASLYQSTVPWLSLGGLGLYLALSAAALLRRSPAWVAAWAVTSALLGGLAARLLILVLIQVTSFSGIRVDYMAPMYPLLLLFDGLLAIWWLEQAAGRFLQPQNRQGR